MGWSLSELLLACLRASRSLAPIQGNLESVWELDSISATSKRRTSRGYPTISMTVSRTRSLGEYIFSDKKVTLLRRFSRCFSFLIYFPHFWWYALKKLIVKMIWFQRDLFIPSLGCSYQRVPKTKWTKKWTEKHEHIIQNVWFLAKPSGWRLKFQSLILQMALWEGEVRRQFYPKSTLMLGFEGIFVYDDDIWYHGFKT